MPCERKHIEAIEKASDNLEAMCDDCQYGHASVLGRVMLDRAISAALDACDESPWRSMESAPKDGTPIIVRTRFGYTGFSKYDGRDWVALEERATYYTEDALDGWMPKPEIAPLPAATEVKP